MWLGKGYCIAIQGLYCNLGGLENCIAGWKIVLQEKAGRLGNCTAEVQLYCNTVECSGFKIVLQLGLVGNRCIARGAWWLTDYIAI